MRHPNLISLVLVTCILQHSELRLPKRLTRQQFVAVASKVLPAEAVSDLEGMIFPSERRLSADGPVLLASTGISVTNG